MCTSFCSIILCVKSMHNFFNYIFCTTWNGFHSLIVNSQNHKKASDMKKTTPNAKCDENMLINLRSVSFQKLFNNNNHSLLRTSWTINDAQWEFVGKLMRFFFVLQKWLYLHGAWKCNTPTKEKPGFISLQLKALQIFTTWDSWWFEVN